MLMCCKITHLYFVNKTFSNLFSDEIRKRSIYDKCLCMTGVCPTSYNFVHLLNKMLFPAI